MVLKYYALYFDDDSNAHWALFVNQRSEALIQSFWTQKIVTKK